MNYNLIYCSRRCATEKCKRNLKNLGLISSGSVETREFTCCEDYKLPCFLDPNRNK